MDRADDADHVSARGRLPEASSVISEVAKQYLSVYLFKEIFCLSAKQT